MNIIATELRAEIYKHLSRGFQVPDEQLLVRARELHELISLLYPEKVKELSISFNDLHYTLDELKIEHARLFIGPFKNLAPPYGSIYLDHDEHLMTNSTLDVQKRYEKEGMTVAILEVPDHLTIELEFLYLLAYKEMKGIELLESANHKNGVSKDQDSHEPIPGSTADLPTDLVKEYRIKQLNFLKSHLMRWFPLFEKKVKEHAKIEVYADLATLARNFLESEMSELIHDS